MTYKEFLEIPSTLAREVILSQTLAQIEDGVKRPHSFQTIVEESRQLGLACRMLGKGVANINGNTYTGKDVADVFVDSVKANGKVYYPVSGDWTTTPVESLTLFVKDANKEYQPYAKFHINKVIASYTQPADFNNFCVIPDFLNGFTYKSLLILDAVQTTNLPQNYLGVSSGICIRKRAFKGGAPNILVI